MRRVLAVLVMGALSVSLARALLQFVRRRKSYQEAQLYCLETFNGRLASMHAVSDVTDVRAIIANRMTILDSFWIGLSKLEDPNMWTWADCTPMKFIRWHAGYPLADKKRFIFRCGASMSLDAFWINDNCDTQKYFMCEYNTTRIDKNCPIFTSNDWIIRDKSEWHKPRVKFDREHSAPLKWRLGSRLKHYDVIAIYGLVFDPEKTKSEEHQTRFSANFMKNQYMNRVDDEKNLLHIDFRLHYDFTEIVTNSASHMNWGRERRDYNVWNEPKSNPDENIVDGGKFDLRIKMENNHFNIQLFGKPMRKFYYTDPIEEIDTVFVNYDMNVFGIHRAYRQFPIPYRTEFPGSRLKRAESFHVYGFSISNGSVFIEILNKDKAPVFHMANEVGQDMVFSGIKSDGVWGFDEIKEGSALWNNCSFHLAFYNDVDGIRVYTHDSFVYHFKHRVAKPEEDYRYFQIRGDVFLDAIEYSMF